MTCPNHFECARCHRTFTRTASFDPVAEAIARFGAVPENAVSLCDECDREMRAWLATPEGQAALAEWKTNPR